MENTEQSKTEEKVTQELTAEQKERIELHNKYKFVISRLKEMQNLFKYLETVHCKSRHERKQFRREIISNDKFAQSLIDSVIKFYDAGVKVSETGDNNRRG